MPIELDATAKLACRSDGFRVGYAIPNSDLTTGDEQRAICFVNFMIKNGLAAQNTWTAAAAPQEEMYTGREWDKHEIMGNLVVGTQVDYF